MQHQSIVMPPGTVVAKAHIKKKERQRDSESETERNKETKERMGERET